MVSRRRSHLSNDCEVIVLPVSPRLDCTTGEYVILEPAPPDRKNVTSRKPPTTPTTRTAPISFPIFDSGPLSSRIPTTGAGEDDWVSPAGRNVSFTARGISITRREDGQTCPDLYSSSFRSPKIM